MQQFKTLEDLRELVKELKSYYARPMIRGEHPTLYISENDKKNKTIVSGVRHRDFLFSACSKWVQPCDSKGLSFSGHWQHIKRIYRMKMNHAEGKPIDVYWTFDEADLPDGLAFNVDPNDRKKQHYLLTVTKPMTVNQLADKLQWVADHMSQIYDAGRVLK